MAGLRSGPPNEAHTQKVLSVIDTNAAFLQAPGVGDQISSAIDRVLQGFAEVNRKVWLGSKFIDSSVSPICYERRLREGNSELKRLALEKPTFRPIIPEAKPTLQDETGAVLVDFSKQKEDTGAPYESFHQALRALTPPIQAVRGSDTYPSRWKNINAPVREALLVFPWDLDDFPESPPQKRDGQSFVSVSAEEQAFTKEDIMMIFTALPATPAALQSFLEGSPVDKGEERGYQRTLGAFKEAAKQHGVQLIFVNTAVAHGGGHDEMAGIASTDSLELALHEAGIGILPLQALAFGGDSIPAFATLPALLGQPVKPVSESPVCAGFFGEIPIQLSHQRPEGSPKNPPALAVFGSSTTVALLRPSDEKWYRAPRKDLDRQEQYTLRSEGGGQAAAYFADILCKLNNQHSVLFLTVQDEAFSFNAVLEPCSPSCALLTLRRDAILASTQLQLSLLAESAWKPESCQLVDQIAADIRRAYVALKAQLAAQQKVAAPPCTELVGALKEASQEREVEYKEELPWIQKLPAARPLLPSHEWGEGDTKYWQSGGGKKRPGRRRSKEGKEGAEKSQRKRPREGAEAGEKLERRKKRREGKLMKAEGAEKGEEAKRPQEEEADSGRREGPQRSENKSASAGQSEWKFGTSCSATKRKQKRALFLSKISSTTNRFFIVAECDADGGCFCWFVKYY